MVSLVEEEVGETGAPSWFMDQTTRRKRALEDIRWVFAEARKASSVQELYRVFEESEVAVTFDATPDGRVLDAKFTSFAYGRHVATARELGIDLPKNFFWDNWKMSAQDFAFVSGAQMNLGAFRSTFYVRDGGRMHVIKGGQILTPELIKRLAEKRNFDRGKRFHRRPRSRAPIGDDGAAIVWPEGGPAYEEYLARHSPRGFSSSRARRHAIRTEKARKEIRKMAELLDRGALGAEEYRILRAGPTPAWRAERRGVVDQAFQAKLEKFPAFQQEVLRPYVASAARQLEASPELVPDLYLDTVRRALQVESPGQVIGNLGKISDHHSYQDLVADFHFRRRPRAEPLFEQAEAAAIERLRNARNLHRGLYEETARLLPPVPVAKRDEVLRGFEAGARQLAVARPGPSAYSAQDLEEWRQALVSGKRHNVGDYVMAYRNARDHAIDQALPRIEAAYHVARRWNAPGERSPVELRQIRQYGRAGALHGFLAKHGRGPVPPLARLGERARAALGQQLKAHSFGGLVRAGKHPLATAKILSKALVRAVVENAILGGSHGAEAVKGALRVARADFMTMALDSMRKGLSR